MREESKVINMDKYKLKKFLEQNGFQWHEDGNGKVRIWIRKAPGKQNPVSGFRATPPVH